jgi:hypothetical protein
MMTDHASFCANNAGSVLNCIRLASTNAMICALADSKVGSYLKRAKAERHVS